MRKESKAFEKARKNMERMTNNPPKGIKKFSKIYAGFTEEDMRAMEDSVVRYGMLKMIGIDPEDFRTLKTHTIDGKKVPLTNYQMEVIEDMAVRNVAVKTMLGK